MRQFDFDIAILGGGLHGGLVAAALARLDPPPRMLLVERSYELAGNHVWSCHTTDVGDELGLLDSLPTIRWPWYEVRFQNLERRLPLEYRSMHSTEFATFVRTELDRVEADVRVGANAEIIDDFHVNVDDKFSAEVQLIVDARGMTADADRAKCGWQKFMGQEVELVQPSGCDVPTVMDAGGKISQADGYHFLYTLPFSETRLLIEDTYYSDDGTIDEAASRGVIADYAKSRGWEIRRVVREERGVLPIPLERTSLPSVADSPKPIVVGWRGGWFHPTTGYSFGLGVRVATAVARTWRESNGVERAELKRLAARVRTQGAFARRLNNLLFNAFAPEDRMHVLERFHRILTDEAVARFYGLETRLRDRVRLLVGRPPRGFSLSRMFASRREGPR